MSFDLKNRLTELDRMLQHLERFRESTGLPLRTAFEVNLALEELFTNIVLYGYADKAEHRIRFSLCQENGTLVICVEDDGSPFDLTEAQPPNIHCNLDERTVGGLGIHLIRKYIDRVTYRREENKNVLTLTKIVRPV